ncbi:Hypothetical Protein RradSPS_0522 [Rubrobacter radiotolerans]|uniref:Lipoprotein n=1 Tax=Rubrobacter radiotolerans TaxID=42256 RepID=A0A023X1B0_RUBRA|nr:hypothetical protein [Rubrobacter radiotolerans]AHY45805.1 Hypothetical Protein RradSPS_0522 [Rubrobacter radiotolerans]MDX5893219.1 hypothetical protein [Rubrobacter radiotolerans]SMC03303.1 hypothetical protein SAMN00767673_0522 [Rubrobacter radiotolerans DSM 5868]
MTSRPTRLPSIRLPLSFAALLLLLLFPAACAGEERSVELGWTPDAPAVYRVSVSAESGFSGPVSDAEGATDLTAALRVTPVSEAEAEVEVLYLAASVADASGDSVALDLPDLRGSAATVRFAPPGVASEVTGDDRLLGAEIPLVSMEEVILGLFPPLPEGNFGPADTWTGDVPSPFPNLGEEPVRARYVVGSVRPDGNGTAASVEGYELSVSPRAFTAPTAGDDVSGEGHLDLEFEGELASGGGYTGTYRRATFDSDFLRLGGGGYANGSLRLVSEMEVERLGPFEQMGLGLEAGE